MISVLTVCTGNICRSPLVETVLRARLPEGVRVTSAGTAAVPGTPMTAQAVASAILLGADPGHLAAHRARVVGDGDIVDAALLIALDRGHRRRLVERDPRALRRTFTAREFARLAAAIPDAELDDALSGIPAPQDRLASALALVGRRRGFVATPDDPSDDDVDDPYGGTDDAYRAAAEQVSPALDQLTRVLSAVTR